MTETRLDVVREFYGTRAQLMDAPFENSYTRGELLAADEIVKLRAKLAGVREAAAPMLVSCENFHHEKKDRHGPFEECPVWARWNAALTAALDGAA